MKKVLSLILTVGLILVLTGGFLVWDRYRQNPEQIVPFPYTFQKQAPALTIDAPILIAGDRMGMYFSKFKTGLSETISVNLSKPIKIQSIAQEGHALHRTIHELKGLTQWPQILIYQGGSEEFSEKTFNPSEIALIKKNFSLFQDDRIETMLILFPWLSRLVYEPLKLVSLPEKPQLQIPEEKEYLSRMEVGLLLYRQELLELIGMARDKNSLLILTTTPINLDEKPHKVCEFTTNVEIETEILELRELLKANNPKAAYAKSSQMIKKYTGNAELLFIHGQTSRRLGKTNEAIESLLSVSAYDCEPWRATELQNSIIRKLAQENQVLLFDFARMLEKDFTLNTTFFDEIHPQNLYYDKGMKQLGTVIRNILKL